MNIISSLIPKLIYKYKIGDGGYFYNCGATLNAIQAEGNDGKWFIPSNAGGVCANFTTQSGIVQKSPWDIGITYKRINLSTSSDTVIARWRMINTDGPVNDSLDYIYKIKIIGRTLVIKVRVCDNSSKSASFNLDRCENALNARVVKVPYLTLFNLLFSNGGYTSLFFDWERTNASSLNPMDPESYNVVENKDTSLVSKRFSQIAVYNPKTDGQRNPLKETIYLTTSSVINEVLPNLVLPSTPCAS